MAGSEAIAVVIRAWPADAAPNSTDQIPSGRFLTGIEVRNFWAPSCNIRKTIRLLIVLTVTYVTSGSNCKSIRTASK